MRAGDTVDRDGAGSGELRGAATKAAELARERARATEERRALPPDVVDALIDSGLCRAGVPASLGGPEMPPGQVLSTTEELARGDASVGWCAAIAATTSLLSAYLPTEGASEVFGDPRSVASGVWAPRGTARPVAGGVRVSGRWGFCSGVTHADWMIVGCLLADPDAAEGAAPAVRCVAMRTSELEVLDTWHTSGLRGTGSHDVVATDVFVPDHRVTSLGAGPRSAGTALSRFPLFGFFALAVASAALGNARGAMDDLVELASTRRPSGSSRTLAERASTQSTVARAEASLRAAHLLYHRSVSDTWEAAREEGPVPVDLRVGLRLAATHAAVTAREVVSAVYDLGGGASIYEDSPLQRRFRDAHTVTAHLQVNAATFEVTGRHLLGLPIRTDQL